MWGTRTPSGKCQKFQEIQAIKDERQCQAKGRSKEFQEIHSRGPEWAFWDDFPWRMRMANVDMLGTRDL